MTREALIEKVDDIIETCFSEVYSDKQANQIIDLIESEYQDRVIEATLHEIDWLEPEAKLGLIEAIKQVKL